MTENRFGATGVIVALTGASRAIHSDEHGGERAAVPREGTRVSQRPHAQFVLLLEALPFLAGPALAAEPGGSFRPPCD